jgi:hypothetical protein
MKTIFTWILLLFNLLALNQLAQTYNLAWAKHLGSAETEGKFITIDDSSNIIIVGNYNYPFDVDFKPSYSLLNYTSTFVRGSFIAKYKSDLSLVWAYEIPTVSAKFISGIITDAENNIYLHGNFLGTQNFALKPTQSYSLTGTIGTLNGFILKIDKNANVLWGKEITGKKLVTVSSLCIDNQNNVYATGLYTDTTNFNINGNSRILYSSNRQNAYFSKYDKFGNHINVTRIGGDSCYSKGDKLEIDKIGNIIIKGTYRKPCKVYDTQNTLIGNSSNFNIFFCKYSPLGDFSFFASIAGKSNTGTTEVVGIGKAPTETMKINSKNEIVCSGYYNGFLDFDPSPDSLILQGINDSYILHLDTLGRLKWAGRIGGNQYADVIYDLKLDSNDDIFVAGSYTGLCDFNLGAGISVLTSTSTSSTAFVAGYSKTNGNLNWVKDYKSQKSETFSLVFDKLNNLYVIGYYTNNCDFSDNSSSFLLGTNGTNDLFLAKYYKSPIRIKENENAIKLLIYPNPCSEELNFSLDGDKIKAIEIADCSAKYLMGLTGRDLKKINISTLQTGIYLLTLTTENNKLIHHKLVKH